MLCDSLRSKTNNHVLFTIVNKINNKHKLNLDLKVESCLYSIITCQAMTRSAEHSSKHLSLKLNEEWFEFSHWFLRNGGEFSHWLLRSEVWIFSLVPLRSEVWIFSLVLIRSEVWIFSLVLIRSEVWIFSLVLEWSLNFLLGIYKESSLNFLLGIYKEWSLNFLLGSLILSHI